VPTCYPSPLRICAHRVRHADGNLAFGVACFGHLARGHFGPSEPVFLGPAEIQSADTHAGGREAAFGRRLAARAARATRRSMKPGAAGADLALTVRVAGSQVLQNPLTSGRLDPSGRPPTRDSAFTPGARESPRRSHTKRYNTYRY
jgi:hypothetical protein